jgi:hypothetical protein
MERASKEQEDKVKAFLKSIDGLLDIRWYPAIRRYALVAIWPNDYPLREMFKRGEVDDDCDILGWYSQDVQDADTSPVGLDGMEAKVLQILAKSDNIKTPWKLRLSQVAERNAARRSAIRKPVLDQVEQIAKDLEYMAGHNEEVRMQRIMKDAASEYSTQ